MTVALSGTAFAADAERLCGAFKVLKSPDAVRYSGKYDENSRPHTLVIAERLDDGKALVFYVYGKRPGRDSDSEGCSPRVARFKDDAVLFVKLTRRFGATYLFDGDTATVEWTSRDRDGYVKKRLRGSLKRQ